MFSESEFGQICKHFEGRRSTAGVDQAEGIYIIEKNVFPEAMLPYCVTLFCQRLMSSTMELPSSGRAFDVFMSVEEAIGECRECSVLTGFRLYTHVRNTHGDTLIWSCNYSFLKDESFPFNKRKWELDKHGRQKWYEDFYTGYKALCEEIAE